MPVDPKKVAGTFCPSPWIHFVVEPNGNYSPCRWGRAYSPKVDGVHSVSPIEFFNSKVMNDIRTQMVNGENTGFCQRCLNEESYNKVSGRQKQLMRFKLDGPDFADKWELADTSIFEYSEQNGGKTPEHPYDLQVDLGNSCNAECISCEPMASSKITTTFNKLNYRNSSIFPFSTQPSPWSFNDSTVNKFIEGLHDLKRIEYLHFIGGEPLIMRSFYRICESLIESGKSKETIVGIATNGTVWDSKVENIFAGFRSAHIGVSIDAYRSLNDYLRYPSELNTCISTLDSALALKEKNSGVFVLLRPTQTLFAMYYVDELLDLVMPRNLTWESCGLLIKPRHLLVEIMSDSMRQETIQKLYNSVKKYELVKHSGPVVDTRNVNLRLGVISDTIFSLIHFMETYSPPADSEKLRFDLVDYLHGLETLRGNCILDHAPEFEPFLRSYGYEG